MVAWRTINVVPDLAAIFLDTSYINALVNTRDSWHNAAARWERYLASARRRLVTTEFILVEVADGLAAVRFRAHATRVIAMLQGSPWVEIVPASSHLFTSALELYRHHADKHWGLTDCASFTVMGDRPLTEALTADDHFRQAGFRALLLESLPEGSPT